MICDPRFHRRRHAQRLVNPAEVVVRVPERHASLRPSGSPTFWKSIRETSEAAATHADAKVAALDDRSVDAGRIGISADWDHLHGRNFGGRVLISGAKNQKEVELIDRLIQA